jgi:anti-sigma28 factor (negative regulator of flagellin synthesis)
VLQNLLILWNSLKAKQKLVNKGAAYEAASNLALKAIFKDKQDLQENAKNNQDMFPPLVISLKEIEQRALSLQKTLVEEIQKPTEPLMSTLEKKVALLRKAIGDGELVDTKKKLTYYIQEATTLEQAILQSSNDCLQLSTRIIKKCNE